jgi:ubiquinone/menaquinone biosynthesis C-methylase UbiE
MPAGACTASRLYESGMLEKAAGGVMRPGGLELTARAMDYCAFAAGANLVDVGCGAGLTVEFLREAYGLNAMGFDSSSVIVERGLHRNPQLPLRQASGENLPLADGAMDGVLVECVLSAMADKQRAMAEFHRVLAPDGRLIITDLYARQSAVTSEMGLPATSCLAGMKTREQLGLLLKEAGFSIEVWKDHTPKLSEFVIRMIMEHGSMQPFWECQNSDARLVQGAIKASKPGYFLLIARKTREFAEGDSHEW